MLMKLGIQCKIRRNVTFLRATVIFDTQSRSFFCSVFGLFEIAVLSAVVSKQTRASHS
jgi:hypothetical protein